MNENTLEKEGWQIVNVGNKKTFSNKQVYVLRELCNHHLVSEIELSKWYGGSKLALTSGIRALINDGFNIRFIKLNKVKYYYLERR